LLKEVLVIAGSYPLHPQSPNTRVAYSKFS